MKLELTIQELNDLTNNDRVVYLEKEVASLSQENRELRQKVQSNQAKYSDSNHLAQVMVAVSRFFACQKHSTAEALRYTLEDLLPNQKILQIKVLREVTGAGLKASKEFLEGVTNTLPLATEDLEIPF